MPALLLLVVFLAPLLAGCMQGGARSDGIPTAEAPFTLTALDVGQSAFPVRGIGSRALLSPTGPPAPADAGVERAASMSRMKIACRVHRAHAVIGEDSVAFGSRTLPKVFWRPQAPG